MAKIKITADVILNIFKTLLQDEEIDVKITDRFAPADWQDKKIQEILNIEYFAFNYVPEDTEEIVKKLLEENESADQLYSLTRSFCLLSIDSKDRVFSDKRDIVSVSTNIEYWIQSDKVKLLEDFLDDLAIKTTGLRLPIQVGKETRKCEMVFSSLSIGETQEESEFGQMTVCDLTLDIIFYPNTVGIQDYKVSFLVPDGNVTKWVNVPITSISISDNMTQRAIPKINNPGSIGNVNLSKAKVITIGFDGEDNLVTDYLIRRNLKPNNSNNEVLLTKVIRCEEEFEFNCTIKSHNIVLDEDSRSEAHSLTLTIGGLTNGSS